MTDLVGRKDHQGWTLLTLNRPDKLNALTVEMFRELRRHVIDLRDDDGIGCVVVRGAGKCFSAGHDLSAIAEGEEVPSPGWHSETLRMLEKLPKPVIAAVHGHCYTGALTDSRPLDAGLQWEVAECEGFGPDMHERIAAFTGRSR